jgi:hypothetical protein
MCAGCARDRVLPGDKVVRYLPPGHTYTAPAEGAWIVPPARMREILRKLDAP